MADEQTGSDKIELATELTIAPEAVARERGVILSEMRDRNTWQLRDTIASTEFLYPRSLFSTRFPIGVAQTLDAATAERLHAFYKREYLPQKVTLIVIGDFDPAMVEQQIRSHFGDWQTTAKPKLQPGAGPIRSSRKPRNSSGERDRSKLAATRNPLVAKKAGRISCVACSSEGGIASAPP